MAPSFLFIQFEFTHAVGPHAGCYVIHPTGSRNGADPGDGSLARLPAPPPRSVNELLGVSGAPGDADVLVITAVDAPVVPFGARRRARRVRGDEPPDPVPLLRAAFVRATAPLPDSASADAELARVTHSDAECQTLIDDGLRTLNQAVRAYRAVAADPGVADVSGRDARRVRIGHGRIVELMRGEWQSAVELPRPRASRKDRTAALRPYEAVAAALAGRLTVLEGEDMLLRALLDLDGGRTRAAAFQLHAALVLMERELAAAGYPGLHDGPTKTTASWSEHRIAAEALAADAQTRTLSAEESERIGSIVDAVTARLEGWRTADPTGVVERAAADQLV